MQYDSTITPWILRDYIPLALLIQFCYDFPDISVFLHLLRVLSHLTRFI